MRPISLRLHAFGSYAGGLHVDFARLSRHGIFAISGPTGAGKSTIFDALVYALYDDLPGFRLDGNVRSQFADPHDATWVSLELAVRGELWRVERRPAQPVRRRRGGGAPVEKKSTVVLGRVGDDGELVPGTVTTRKDEVKRRIDALVGLTKDQFEQVVLIPQGRFEEVLKADTSKRAPLLRRLFPVELFTRVTETLKAVASDRMAAFEEATRARDCVVERLRAAYDAAIAQLPDDVRDAVVGVGGAGGLGGAGDAGGPPVLEVESLAHHVGVLAGALGHVDALVAECGARAESARADLERARRAAGEWDQWQADLAAARLFDGEEGRDAEELGLLERARRLADLRATLAGWEEATRELSEREPELAALAGAIGSAWPDDLDAATWAAASGDAHVAGVLAERLGTEAEHLAAEVGRFDRLVEAGQLLEARRRGLDERRTELAERRLKLDAEEQFVTLVSEEAQRLRAESASLDVLAAAVDAVELEHQMASSRASALAELERFEAELDWASSSAAQAAEQAEAVRTSWRDGLAARLALLLSDGAPCPTCGSLEHPAPAAWLDEGADDETLAGAERALDAALELRGAADRRAAAARAVVGALSETRPVDVVGDDLEARRGALAGVRDAADRRAVVVAEESRRRRALVEARASLDADDRSIGEAAARLDAELAAHGSAVEELVEAHGSFETPAPRAAAREALASDLRQLALALRGTESARSSQRVCAAVLEPVARELGADGPADLFPWLVDPGDLEERTLALDARRARREEVRRRIAGYERRARGDVAADGVGGFGAPGAGGDGGGFGAPARPDVESLATAAGDAASEHLSLVERRAVLTDRAQVLAAGPAEIAEAERAVAEARQALERAKTVAERCAGVGGGPASLRLSLENWVLADYLRQVLVQANHRLDAMTDGRFALELDDGVTDGRKPWGLDLAVFDANTGQVRPATTLSGGETFMAALALALGLADVVSGGSNREVGALFVDEGFGSLDPQSLDAVIDVLRTLEDGGRIVGVISHVLELQQALPTGITVEPSSRGSLATVHYPPG